MRQPRIGLALGCGAAKALVHMGVFKALEEHNIQIHAVSGCSMGAYVGALWATGHSAEEMIQRAEDMKAKNALKELADPIIPPIKALFHGKKMRAQFEKAIGNVNIEELNHRYIAVAANLDNYQRVVFDSGNILDAVHASCAMPGIISPVEINGIRCVDGGVVDPVPVGALRDYMDVDHIIAVSTTPMLRDIDSDNFVPPERDIAEDPEKQSWLKSKLSNLGNKINPAASGNMLDTLRRSLKASQIRIAHDACKRAHLSIHPICKETSWDDFDKYEHFIRLGEESTLEVIDAIKELTQPIPVVEE